MLTAPALVNRNAVVLRVREPFVRWINEVDFSDGPVTLDEVAEGDVFLLPEGAGDSVEEIRRWAERNWRPMFETQLFDWYMEEEGWPGERWLQMFRDWVDLQAHAMVWDLSMEPLSRDEDEDDEDEPA